jgi:hypothetical protein
MIKMDKRPALLLLSQMSDFLTQKRGRYKNSHKKSPRKNFLWAF